MNLKYIIDFMSDEIETQAPLILKKGSSGDLVKTLQGVLHESNTKASFKRSEGEGVFGSQTEKAVMDFQKRNNLEPDGIVGPLTWKRLGFYPEEFYADSDVPNGASWIHNYHLPENEYVKKETSKKYIFLHHTAGRNNPYNTVDYWAQDDRGRIGTNYIIGGLPIDYSKRSSNKADRQYNGRVVRCIKDEYRGYHLGPVSSNAIIENSLSIELCNAGKLEKINDKYFTWFESEVDPSQVIELENEFRGSKYYHAYSQNQLESLKALLIYLSKRHGINLRIGMKEWLEKETFGAFEYKNEADNGNIEGLLSHTNVRTDKSDVYPHPQLIKMIENF
jgi:hypothetical protein